MKFGLPIILSAVKRWFAPVLAGVSLGIAWLMPGSTSAASLGWIAALSFTWISLKSQFPYRHTFAAGVLAWLFATHWLLGTISNFGGFPSAVSLILCLLFALLSALQFVLFAVLCRHMPPLLKRMGLGVASAWSCAELVFPALFPWHLGHTQAAFLPLVQIADIGGAALVSFVVVWIAESALSPGTVIRRAPAFLAFAASLVYGVLCIRHYSEPSAGTAQKITVVQANISIEEKHDVQLFGTNVERYIELSRNAASPGSLVIWPESVITEAISDSISNVKKSETLSSLPRGIPFIVGAVTFESRTRYFNSALAIQSDGSVLPPYHKRILMPFGEFTPLASTFPWLKEINAMAGDFTPGESEAVFDLPARVAPLICYEDLVPGMARASVRAGAELLVNITNDAWYGHSAAPFQHHLIASFRAIENRRFLVRATNTGFTGVVDPLGRTIKSIPIFSEGVLQTEVRMLNGKTLYTSYLSNFPFWLLFAFIGLDNLLRLLTGATMRHLLNALCIAAIASLSMGCNSPAHGPDKTAAGLALGGGWGAGAGAIIGNQVSHAASGTAIGAGFGAAAGALSGAAYDIIESDVKEQEQSIAQLRAQNDANEKSLQDVQTRLDRMSAAAGDFGVYQVFFDIDQTNMRAGAVANLQVLAESFKTNPRAARIMVVGHADDSGNPEYNQQLSEARAREVAGYLMSRGISRDQVRQKALGSSNPIASNTSPAGRQLNRRVDVYIGRD